VGVFDGSHVGGADLFGHVGTTGGALLCGLQILCFVGLRVGTVVGSLVGATVWTVSGEEGQSKGLASLSVAPPALALEAVSNHPIVPVVSSAATSIIVTQRRFQKEMKFDRLCSAS
jgi:hypothetical protein